MNRYRLRLLNGEEVVFEARPSDVSLGDTGIKVWEFEAGKAAPARSRFFPYASIAELSNERVAWRAVS